MTERGKDYSSGFCGDKIWSWANDLEKSISPMLDRVRRGAQKNHFKVLRAFQALEVSDYHFQESTGYGYGDVGRDVLDSLFARVFGAEAALVRPQIVSGTHAIALCLYGLLRPGDEVVSITGQPYDTLVKIVDGRHQGDGSLRDWGIKHLVVPLVGGKPDFDGIERAITGRTRLVAIQRSRGYSLRPSLSIKEIKDLINHVKGLKPDVICFVDNCYGEFVEELEPPEVGADVIAGSLIKNPGGGIAPAGGYIAGKAELVERITHRLTAPGLGGELGCSLGGKRLYFQGLFLAPLIVSEALQGAVLAAKLFSELGFAVEPHWDEERTDIIQAITLGSKERLVAFCQGLQKGSPVDSHITPEAAPMPGYEDAVIMAGGTFIQGSSIELSADGPLREPYTVFLQGGLAYPYIKAGLLTAIDHMVKQGLLAL